MRAKPFLDFPPGRHPDPAPWVRGGHDAVHGPPDPAGGLARVAPADIEQARPGGLVAFAVGL
ncbi:hypothetical protein [Nonomuraea sp. GTA35]|uniref:hypothetical protein n=1 Tax=Nonomuraea sp. GTA35 TaxID=1676746 RepID=UPI0035C244CF